MKSWDVQAEEPENETKLRDSGVTPRQNSVFEAKE